MKKDQLIEYGIITIGLVFGYKAFDSLFVAIIQIFYLFGGISGNDIGAFLPSLFILAAYTACFILLIRNSRQIAIYLGGIPPGENVPFKIGKRSLLQVVLIGICVATILSGVAEIILFLFDFFKQEAGRRNFIDNNNTGVNTYVFKLAAIRTIIAIVILYFSKDISGWFIRKNEADELTFESEPEKDQ